MIRRISFNALYAASNHSPETHTNPQQTFRPSLTRMLKVAIARPVSITSSGKPLALHVSCRTRKWSVYEEAGGEEEEEEEEDEDEEEGKEGEDWSEGCCRAARRLLCTPRITKS